MPSLHARRPGTARKLEELVVETLVACLEEMASVSSALLAVLLQCFLDGPAVSTFFWVANWFNSSPF